MKLKKNREIKFTFTIRLCFSYGPFISFKLDVVDDDDDDNVDYFDVDGDDDDDVRHGRASCCAPTRRKRPLQNDNL